MTFTCFVDIQYFFTCMRETEDQTGKLLQCQLSQISRVLYPSGTINQNHQLFYTVTDIYTYISFALEHKYVLLCYQIMDNYNYRLEKQILNVLLYSQELRSQNLFIQRSRFIYYLVIIIITSLQFVNKINNASRTQSTESEFLPVFTKYYILSVSKSTPKLRSRRTKSCELFHHWTTRLD